MNPYLLAGPGPKRLAILCRRVALLPVAVLAAAMLALPAAADGRTPAGLSAGEWDGIQQQIAVSEYQAAPIPGEQALAADNARQRLAMRFDDSGLAVQPQQSSSWTLQLDTLGYGRAGQLREVGKAAPRAAANRVSYRHESLGLTEWYVNTREGVEHGYTLREAPAGQGEVQLTIAARGLTARLDGADNIAFVDGQGQVRLGYGKLLVLDHAGKTLPASLGTQPDGSLRIAFDDRGAVYPVVVDPLLASPSQVLTASDGAAGDEFGSSVAVSGDTVLVGARFDDVGGRANQGSAYVFVRSGGVWSQQAQLTASDGAAEDRFGSAVALSGDTALVGAHQDAVGTNTRQGSAYVFVRSGGVWIQQAKLTASDGTQVDEFGISVALSGDTAVVGAHLDDIGGVREQGSAYVFVRSGAFWSQQAQLIASDGLTQDGFGRVVALSGDTALVAALNPNNVSEKGVYAFVRSGGTWSQQAKLTSSGTQVALSGDTALVGRAGSARVFLRSGGTWSQQASLLPGDASGNAFGRAVALTSDTALVAAPSAGTAYLFRRSGGNWSQQAKLLASGGSAALSDDTALLGKPTDLGLAYVFDIGNDHGDAPDSYGTLDSGDGPRHAVVGRGLMLGSLADTEPDGQPQAAAAGDDMAGQDDEDGVSFEALRAGSTSTVTFNASSAGFVDLWIDINRNGDFFDAEDLLLAGRPVTAGANAMPINIPLTAATGSSFARVRLSSAGGLGPLGAAADGEVEDYPVTIQPCSSTGTVRFEPANYQFSEAAVSDSAIAVFSGSCTGATVSYATVAGTAAEPADFSHRSGQLSWGPGETGNRGVTIPIVRDSIGEVTESFRVVLSNPSPGVSIATPTATITIRDNDSSVQFSPNTATVNENAGSVTLTVTRVGGATDAAMSVSYQLVPVTAQPGSDYSMPASTTLNWAAHDSGSKTIVIPLVKDRAVEPSENFRVQLSNPVGGTLGTAYINSVTITDTDATDSFDYGDAPDSYGTSISGNGPYHALGGSLKLGALVDSEADGQPQAAAAGDDSAGQDDEDGVSFGTLTAGSAGTVMVNASGFGYVDLWIDLNRDGDFLDADELRLARRPVNAGNNNLPITIPVTVAGNAFARVRLSSAGGLGPLGVAADGEVEDYLVNIQPCTGNNSAPVSFSPNSYSVSEGAAAAGLTVRFEGTGCAVVRYTTVNSSATAPADFIAGSGFMSFDGPGARSISVPIVNDAVAEVPQSFQVRLSDPNPGVVIDKGSATVTIQDNDSSVQFSPYTASVNEDAGSVTLTVTRVGSSAGAMSVSYVLGSVSAKQGSDYSVPAGNTLNWAAGDGSSKSIVVPLVNDNSPEPSETFRVVLSNPVGGHLGATYINTVTITDTDTGSGGDTLRFAPNEYSVTETPGGTTLNLTVTRSGTGAGAVSVDYDTNYAFPGMVNLATSGVDYTGGTGSLNWADSDLSPRTITLAILDDGDVEPAERIGVRLFNVAGAVLGPQSVGVVGLNDND